MAMAAALAMAKVELGVASKTPQSATRLFLAASPTNQLISMTRPAFRPPRRTRIRERSVAGRVPGKSTPRRCRNRLPSVADRFSQPGHARVMPVAGNRCFRVCDVCTPPACGGAPTPAEVPSTAFPGFCGGRSETLCPIRNESSPGEGCAHTRPTLNRPVPRPAFGGCSCCGRSIPL